MGMTCNLGLLEGGESETVRINQVGERVKRTRNHWAVIAYSERCQICDLQRFSFGTRGQD